MRLSRVIASPALLIGARRRAKAKLQLKLKTRTVEKLEPPPESPPELASGFDAGVDELIHEDEGEQQVSRANVLY